MARIGITYRCSECGSQSPLPLGRCPRCSSWNSMVEVRPSTPSSSRRRESGGIPLTTLGAVSETALARSPSGLEEVDRVLGGGWVAGSVLLIAGEPGIGKSTLLLQLAHHATRRGRTPLYVAGEESLSQLKQRAERLDISAELQLTREVDAGVLADHLLSARPPLVIIDSIQTLLVGDGGTPGSLTQVRDATALLTRAAKEADSTLVLIGHVTKQGIIAGPKVIEHMVDATLALETAAGYRVLRALKNRYGPAGEVGVFEMTTGGMIPVSNPSEAFLAEKPIGVPGSVVVAALEGQRSLLLEVQALASKSPYASPRRVVQGLDQRRVDVVLAVLERRLELPLAGLDVYINVAGGLRLTDPGTDLAVAVAAYSAVTNRAVPEGTALVGEVGLAGELRSVSQLGRRLLEAERAGYARVIGPLSAELPTTGSRSLAEALEVVWRKDT